MSDPVRSETFVLFSVAGTAYALHSDDVRHMEMVEQITPVPNAAPYLEGVVFSRGRIVPVVNLRVRFGFERSAMDLRTRLLVVQSGERWVGLLVDQAREFVRIPSTAIQPPAHAITGAAAAYLHGIATHRDRLVLVLNVARVLEDTAASGDDAAGAAAWNGADPDLTRQKATAGGQ